MDVTGPDAEVKYWNAVIVGGLFDHIKTIDTYNNNIKVRKNITIILVINTRLTMDSLFSFIVIFTPQGGLLW